jgi:hypothetical protein
VLVLQLGQCRVDRVRGGSDPCGSQICNSRETQEVIERPEETDDILRLGLHRLTVTEFPQVRALASALANYDGAVELDRGLDLLMLGLTATLTPPGTSRS